MSVNHTGSRVRRRAALGIGIVAVGASLALAGPAPGALGGGGAGRRAAVKGAPPADEQVAATYAKLPLSFAPNVGQADAAARFVSRGGGYALSLAPTRAVLALSPSPEPGRPGASGPATTGAGDAHLLGMSLAGADPAAAMVPTKALPGTANYLTGDDPGAWHVGVPTYGEVTTAGVYPGIDLVWYGTGGALEYDFRVAPGADASAIRVDFEGTRRLSLAANGDLNVDTGTGTVVQRAPKLYQDIDGARRPVEGRYVLTGDHQVGFAVGDHDPAHGLVIDPVLAYSTYLGGTGEDGGASIAVDATGAAYVTGYTGSPDFPTAIPLQAGSGGNIDAFVTKLNPAGSALEYSTYLGGTGNDGADAIAVDAVGAASVAGYTSSTTFPTADPLQAANGGGYDAFVAKLDPAGSSLAYSTYLGGTGNDGGSGIAVDGAGAAYVTGYTTSAAFPTANPFQAARAGLVDAFVTKVNPAGSALAYSSYLGGTDYDAGYSIDVNDGGTASVTGYTESTDFPTANPLQPANAGLIDAFVTTFDPAGSALEYSTYLGGTGNDAGNGITVDATGAAYLVGDTSSTDLPTVNPVQAANAGDSDAFVAKLSPSGSAMIYSSYLGGTGTDLGYGIAVDAAGGAHVTGITTSTDFPTAAPLQAAKAGAYDAFVTALDPAGSAHVYSSYLGGTGTDLGYGIAVDAAGAAYVTGHTSSTTFPTLNPLQAANGGSQDVYVAKVSPTVGPTCLGAAATIVGTAGNDRIFGTPGPDVILGLGGDDSIYGFGGDDVVCGGDGNDVIDGGAGNDTIDGEAGEDRAIGGLGNDDVRGGDGSDRVFGNAGNDQVTGGGNVDYCYGGTGTNVFATCEIYPAGSA